VSGTFQPHRGKFEHFYSAKNDDTFFLRSSLESKYARRLEADDSVIGYEVEPLRIPYEFEGSYHNYIPDFLVDREGSSPRMVEVKASWVVDAGPEKFKAKCEAARRFCDANGIEFDVVTEKELGT
jgi:hypothetical protein